MKVAIIGAGNSGCAQAFKLAERGHHVRLIKTSHSVHDDNFEMVKTNGGIYCVDSTQNDKISFVRLELITRDVESGIAGADVIMVLTQSLQHRFLAPVLCPLLKRGQMVFSIPGNMASAYFSRLTKEEGVIFLDGESTPYDARICKPGTVNVLFRNVRNAVAFLDSKHNSYLPIIDELFGLHKYLRTNVIESAMQNPNMIVHTIGAIMSASRIEFANGDFWMYRESFSPSIWNLIFKLDEEKNSVIEAFGGEKLSYLDACKWRNEEDLTQDSKKVFEGYAVSGGPKGPDSLDTRYIYEDVPMGLCLLENLGYCKGIKTPIASSLINIASSLKNVDYRTVAYKLGDLGL